VSERKLAPSNGGKPKRKRSLEAGIQTLQALKFTARQYKGRVVANTYNRSLLLLISPKIERGFCH
jgi:hypothetical protein